MAVQLAMGGRYLDGSLVVLLSQYKVDFNIHLDRDRRAIFFGWFKAILFDRFDGFFIQPHAKGTHNPRILR
jgi:hypothetical protein